MPWRRRSARRPARARAVRPPRPGAPRRRARRRRSSRSSACSVCSPIGARMSAASTKSTYGDCAATRAMALGVAAPRSRLDFGRAAASTSSRASVDMPERRDRPPIRALASPSMSSTSVASASAARPSRRASRLVDEQDRPDHLHVTAVAACARARPGSPPWPRAGRSRPRGCAHVAAGRGSRDSGALPAHRRSVDEGERLVPPAERMAREVDEIPSSEPRALDVPLRSACSMHCSVSDTTRFEVADHLVRPTQVRHRASGDVAPPPDELERALEILDTSA